MAERMLLGQAYLGRKIRLALQDFGKQVLDTEVSIHAVDVSIRGFVTIRGVRIMNPEYEGITWESPQMFELEKVEVNANVISFMLAGAKHLEINEVDVKGLKAEYEVVEGQCNIRVLQAYLPEPGKPRKKKPQQKKPDKHHKEPADGKGDDGKKPDAHHKEPAHGKGAADGKLKLAAAAPAEEEEDDEPEIPKISPDTTVTLKKVKIEDLTVDLRGPVKMSDGSHAVQMHGLHVGLEDLQYQDFSAKSSHAGAHAVAHYFVKTTVGSVVGRFL